MRCFLFSIYLLGLSTCFMCSNSDIAGGGDDFPNSIIGIVVDTTGSPSSPILVRLVPHDYNPMIDGDLPASFIDTTDDTGYYQLVTTVKGLYSIEAVHLTVATRALLTSLNVADETTTVSDMTVQAPGAVKLLFPDTVDTAAGYIFVRGTTLQRSLSGAVPVSGGMYSLVVDSMPAADIPGFYYDKKGIPFVPMLLTDTIPVTTTDTVVSEAFVYWANYTTTNSALPDLRIQDIYIDTDGSYWFSTFYGGVAHFDGVAWTVYNTGNSALPRDLVTEVFRDTDGSLWIVTQGGIAIVNGSTWTTLTTSNSMIPTNSLTDFARDRDGNKWFGSFDGVVKFDGLTWTLYSTANTSLPSNEMIHVAVDSSNHIWCCGQNDVAEFDGTTWTTYTTANSGIYADYAYKIFVDSRKNIWFGHEGAVSKFDGTNWQTYDQTNSTILQYRTFEFYEDSDGKIWFGTSYGITIFDGNQFVDVTDERHALLRDKCFYAIEKDPKNNMWFGTADHGVISFGPTKK